MRFKVTVLSHLNREYIVHVDDDERDPEEQARDEAMQQNEHWLEAARVSSEATLVEAVEIVEFPSTTANDIERALNMYAEIVNCNGSWADVIESVESGEVECVYEVQEYAASKDLLLDLEDSTVFDAVRIGLQARVAEHKLANLYEQLTEGR